MRHSLLKIQGDGASASWMAEAGCHLANHHSIIIKDFTPTTSNVDYLHTLCERYHLSISCENDNLVLSPNT